MPIMAGAGESDTTSGSTYQPYVDTAGIKPLPDTPAKRTPLKSFDEIHALLNCGKKNDVKQLLRESPWPLDSPIRRKLWPLLCMQHGRDSVEPGYYWEIVKQLYGTTDLPEKPLMLPQFLEPNRCLSYHLTKQGRFAADRVACVLSYSCPDITYSPVIYPIIALLLHYVPEEDCYNSIACLVGCKDKVFVTQTKLLYEVTWRTVVQIAKKHVKSAVVHISRSCNESSVERLFTNWVWWVMQDLPFTHLVRVIDCFLHEGIKVLYRVAMAVLALFCKQDRIGHDEIVKAGVEVALDKFCKDVSASPAKLLRTAFAIRGLSSASISRIFLRTEMSLKSRSMVTGNRQLTRSRSSDNLPTNQSQVDIQMVSHTLTIREQEDDPFDPQPWTRCFARQNSLYRKGFVSNGDGARSPIEHVASQGFYPVHHVNSHIIDHQGLLTLWSWLPVRITMYQPVLLYTTEEHGCSLTTFYHRVEQHEPTLLMIKTSNNEVFGAYCSTRWVERNLKDDKGNRQAYFGTGETFLFTLHPERAKYPWVGTQKTITDGDADDKGNARSLDHSAELFMAADAKMLTIGGGGSQAIWMDENVRYGKTDHCETFNNPPLCATRDFEIRVLEVYGFVTH